MNKFDQVFFSKYVTEWVEIIWIVHKHIIVIIDKIIINYFFWVILPTFLYYYSDSIKSYIPFFILEIFIIWVFIKNIYDIFNWYNDVWIITKDWVIDLEWKLFSSDSVSIKYDWVEWLELIEKWFLDSFLWKWDIVIHKVWWWEKFMLENAANSYEIIEEIDIITNKIKKEKKAKEEEENKFQEKNFETILTALSSVVEWYLSESWYKKKDSNEETEELIKETKKKNWTIDIR